MERDQVIHIRRLRGIEKFDFFIFCPMHMYDIGQTQA